MDFSYFLIGLLSGGLLVGLFWQLAGRKRKGKTEIVEKEKVGITLQDIIRLAALNSSLDIGSLIIEYKINLKLPEFYGKYQSLMKQEKELYFNELIEIFSRNKRAYVQELFDKYSGFSNQDVLLLLMCEMQVDNKTIGRIMGLGHETLKKRKSRLKSKMNLGDQFMKEVATE